MMALAWAAAGLAYGGLEYWLGRTDKVKAGSVVEILVNAAKFVVTKGK